MKAAEPATEKDARWSKTQYANLIRYVPSGIYFTRIRVRGKLIIKTLKTAQGGFKKLWSPTGVGADGPQRVQVISVNDLLPQAMRAVIPLIT